jgi:hypothetical protein
MISIGERNGNKQSYSQETNVTAPVSVSDGLSSHCGLVRPYTNVHFTICGSCQHVFNRIIAILHSPHA